MFGSHATRKTFAPERASADKWSSWYEGDEVVMTIRRYEDKLIAMARKMGLRHVRFQDKRMKVINYVQSVIYRFLDHDITVFI